MSDIAGRGARDAGREGPGARDAGREGRGARDAGREARVGVAPSAPRTPDPAPRLLSVEGLNTVFDLRGGTAPAVIDVSFHLSAGETLCLVGESGSGKSLTALSIMRLVAPPGRVARGTVTFKGRDLRSLAERDMQQIRGADIAIGKTKQTAVRPRQGVRPRCVTPL